MRRRAAIAVVAFLALAIALGGALVAQNSFREKDLPAAQTARLAPLAPPANVDAGLAKGPVPDGAQTASMEDCLAALAVPEGSSRLLAEQRTLDIGGFLERLGSPLEKDLIADMAGYRPQTASFLDNGLPASLFWTYSAPNPAGERRLPAAERRALEGLLAGGEGLWELDDATLGSRWGDTSFAGHLIRLTRERGEALRRTLPSLAGRLPITSHELAIAIEAGVPLADFSALVDAASVDLAATWLNGANLAKLAAIHGRPEILGFLMSSGVDPLAATSWGHRTVLDDIASLPKPPDAEPLAAVVERLIAAGGRPRLPSTLAALRKWLPDTALPPLHPDAAAAITPALESAARTVAEMDAQWQQRIVAAERMEERCEALARSDRFAGAFEGTGLAAKQRHSDALLRREQRWLDSLGDATGAGGESSEAEQALIDAVSDGRWTDALAIADEIGGHRHLILLHIALGADAPRDVLLALAQHNGGVVPKEAASYLADNDRPDASAIAEALEPFGFDPHHVDELGRNAFSVLAEGDLDQEGAWRFARYLASRSVTAKPTAFGLDPLDITLQRLLKLPRWRRGNIRFARFLIDHGAPVEVSHRQLARRIATADANIYQLLVATVPELAS